KAQRILISTSTAVPPAGFVFRIRAFTKQNLVAVRIGSANQALVENPARERLFWTEQRFDVHPIVCALQDDKFPASLDLGEFRGTGIRRKINVCDSDQRAAFCRECVVVEE